MADSVSNRDLESIASAVFARHGVDFATAERAGGWTNAVWLTERLVLRLSTTRDTDNLLREAQLTALLPSAAGYPAILETGRTDGFAWSLAARLPGVPLGEAWADLRTEERVIALQELWGRAQAVHRVPVAQIPASVSRRAWFNSTDAGEAFTGLARVTEAGIITASESQVLRNALNRFWWALPSAPCVLCHGDLTAGNALWHAGHVTSLLDFEFAVLAPIQLDLNHLVKCAFDPSESSNSPANNQGEEELRRAIKELALPLVAQPGGFDLLMGYAILLELWLLEVWLAHPEGEGPLEQWEPLLRLRSLADGRAGYLAALLPSRESRHVGQKHER